MAFNKVSKFLLRYLIRSSLHFHPFLKAVVRAITQTRMPPPPAEIKIGLIANNGINAGIVLPEYQWQQSKTHIINDAVLTVIINAANVGEANLWPKEGGPQVSIEWIKNHLANYGHQLEPGHIILAGTALGLYPVKSGDNIIVLIDGKPAVQCAISANTK